ncbi:MAG: GHKL domain-containing protein [Chlorobi bacterium]|nr:GHKL domain-containing protein [Chlorobiota bacterium]
MTDLTEYDQPQLEQMLIKFSSVFFSDINLYNTSGQLVASSRPEIFNLGLLSENINPMAYEELMVKNKLFYFTRERIGEVSYYSSYAPLELGGDKAAGIVNLPYFAKQTEVTQAYYLMIFTFINLFVFLGIIGAVIAVALSRIITRPLKVLQENIAAIQIDKPNKPIPWANEDEIGKLIREYNKMIRKLEQSAELLKQSERESAWREVAQQIAHEIKNPLTPMKLNVQYLEKAFREKDKDLEEKVRNISNSLISQIESLDKVAEMFSDLAKTRVRNFEKVDLGNVIRESVQLFKNNTTVKISYQPDDIRGHYFTPAFEKDLLRLFNNMIMNAIQSIDKNRDGVVKIVLKEEEQFFVVTIEDNGKGIPDEQKSKIFQPYFTTKSTGTGLGLAIVKNIMQEIGGEITFESKKDTGTVFTLKFRKISQSKFVQE